MPFSEDLYGSGSLLLPYPVWPPARFFVEEWHTRAVRFGNQTLGGEVLIFWAVSACCFVAKGHEESTSRIPSNIVDGQVFPPDPPTARLI